MNIRKPTKEEIAVNKIMDDLAWKKKDEHLAKSNYLKACYETTRVEISLDIAIAAANQARAKRDAKLKGKS